MPSVLPYSAEQRDDASVELLVEKLPTAAQTKYPLIALRAERDLHMDMLRETGVRSEAHLARYQLASDYARDGMVILDAACGLGYGSAMLARQFPRARVIGIDISEYAIDYARTNFGAGLSNLEFHVADACAPEMIADGSVDLIVSFETIEHVREPGKLLQGFCAKMKAGARMIGSVPNLWLDETGRDPNPWHFHVFDLPKFHDLISTHLAVEHVYRQNAGGWLRNPHSAPLLKQVQLPVTDQLDDAEWWIISATSTPATTQVSVSINRPAVWLIDGEQRGHFYTSLREQLDCEWIVGRDAMPQFADIAIVSDEWWWQNSLAVQEMKRRKVPTLHVMDGVIDWKNTWENPRSLTEQAGLPLFQPVLADKIACLGRAQARILTTWGSGAKAEVVGMPRFDRYFALKRRVRPTGAKARILIMTANTPYFNEVQHADILRALTDLKEYLADPVIAAATEPVWRITKGLEAEIGVPSSATEFTGAELATVLGTVDAVICSSSTAILEAMLLGLPTALIDYSNVPHYLQPTWQITAREHIGSTLSELLNPAEAKLLHQEMVLHDSLECRSPAGPRLLALVTAMIELGREARASGENLQLPPRVLATDEICAEENRYNLARLHPRHTVFQMTRISELQAELGHWRNRGRG